MSCLSKVPLDVLRVVISFFDGKDAKVCSELNHGWKQLVLIEVRQNERLFAEGVLNAGESNPIIASRNLGELTLSVFQATRFFFTRPIRTVDLRAALNEHPSILFGRVVICLEDPNHLVRLPLFFKCCHACLACGNFAGAEELAATVPQLTLPPATDPSMVLSTIAEGLGIASLDLARAGNLLRGCDQVAKNDAFSSICAGFTKKGMLEQAMEAANCITDIDLRNRGVANIVLEMAKRGNISEAASIAGSLPLDLREQVLKRIASSMLKHLEHLEQAEEAAHREIPEMLRNYIFANISVRFLANGNVPRMIGIAERISDENLRERVFAEIAEKLADTQPKQALDLAGRISGEHLRDGIFEAVARAIIIKVHYPTRAREIAEKIANQELKQTVLQEIVETLAVRIFQDEKNDFIKAREKAERLTDEYLRQAVVEWLERQAKKPRSDCSIF